ncbi:rhamnogalacturonan acetylesterase [Steroidobacter sp. S1-65]|uniref:Rhamnogalacturonan acetylesterase n=1 Tax=Steroidobacter gossypii TaxID=2805490 RepID=A0ABS1X0W3_9GAMM|nr:rhamnogalacturonan acetylesterase [Steroidobacter gossypii]MBM0106871.1 rhamnogalacturonan acetylesterase [Steroidobacter gossypii]
MRVQSLLGSALLFVSFSCHPASAAPEAPKKIQASKIILIGDSTVAVQGGWGSSFCAEHVTSFAACVNLARGGRSSGSYIAEGSWELALNEARTPGYVNRWVLIQFGHNDQPGKPGRSTDLATEFPANLRRYVTEARAVGAKPILVTPLTRRQFKDGKVQNTLIPWADAVKRVAKEMKVPVIDLNALSSSAVEAMGSTAANEFAQRPPSPEVAAAAATGTTIEAPKETNDRPPANNAKAADPSLPPLAQPKLSFDYTHLGRKGADYFAAMVTAELATQVPEMRPLLIVDQR